MIEGRPLLQPSNGDALEVHETAFLQRDELVALLKTVNDVNKARGGCQFVCKVRASTQAAQYFDALVLQRWRHIFQ